MATGSKGVTGRLLVAGVALVVAAIGFAATRIGGLQGETAAGLRPGERAPELTGIDGWINSEPLTLAGLRGTVVLVDFWTFSCVNCVRTFPHLRALYARYRPFGLEIVGIHAPEFAFERDEANVRAAIARHRLPYPVAIDNEMETWRAFGNHYWPHVYLIDAEGLIRFDHIGEGGEDAIEDAIRSLLVERGARLPPRLDLEGRSFDRRLTPEIYAGHERGLTQGFFGSPEGLTPDTVVDYAPLDPTVVASAGVGGAWFLEGRWEVRGEYVRAAADGARVVLPFRARDVYVVASGPARARVLLDGAPATTGAGADVAAATVTVPRADLYHLVALEGSDERVLALEVSAGFTLYTFTFG